MQQTPRQLVQGSSKGFLASPRFLLKAEFGRDTYTCNKLPRIEREVACMLPFHRPHAGLQVKEMRELLLEGIVTGEVQPLPYTTFTRGQLQEAFRYMSKGAQDEAFTSSHIEALHCLLTGLSCL